jgi:subtilisin family serine protease
MSLGHHFGAHDGTDVEERLHNAISGPGKIIVVSAGNERQSNIHIGGNFHQGQSEEVLFDVARLASAAPQAILTLWHHNTDSFNVRVVTPTGQILDMPQLGQVDHYSSSSQDIEYAVRNYTWSNAIQLQLSLAFTLTARDRDLQGWQLRITCDRASVGRIDGWFHNSGFGGFRSHRLLESSRTVGLPATGQAAITVGSYITRTSWLADVGQMDDVQAVLGRASDFSSQGPTRDGRWKPEIAAPGQYITAALAEGSDLSRWDERSLDNSRLLTIEGTSMAAPVVTGTVALLLQKRPQLTPAEAKEVLQASARRDVHSGPAAWNPAYGHGKVDVQAALQKLSTTAAVGTAAGSPWTP